MNSFSSSCGLGFWLAGSDMSTVTCTRLRLVLQKPGSVGWRTRHQHVFREDEEVRGRICWKLCSVRDCKLSRELLRMVQELHRQNAAQKLTIKHHHPYIVSHSPHVSRLLLQLPHRALRRAFPSIHQAGWDLNNDFIDGWPELFLEHDLRARRFGENGDNTNTVYF